MSVSVSYPGIYIQELPLSAHTITPAPTSIAAFVGYTHPLLTQAFNTAVRLFSFTDYETRFGGLYTSGLVDANVARAVYQFFLNGGSDAYVVGLQPKLLDASGGALGTLGGPTGLNFTAAIASQPAGNGMVFTALEPADRVAMKVSVSNLRASSPIPGSPLNTFDVIVTYGARIETFRGVVIGGDPNLAPDKKINGASTLVSVAPPSGNGFGTSLTANASAAFAITLPAGFATTFSPQDFVDVFEANTSLDKVEIFNLLMVPGVADNLVVSAALSFAERKRAFAILDPPQTAPADGAGSIDTLMTTFPKSQNGALYFPYLLSTDPVTATTIAEPPSGFVAGVYAATDASRGVWKAPAGLATTVLNTVGPLSTGLMNDPRQGVLNLASINCLRSFVGIGTVVWGARTLVADNDAFAQSKYVPVRRMTLFLEQTLLANLRWVVFEPNDEPLWLAIRSSIEAFLLGLFNQGALQGSKPSDAFQVKCDATTTTPADQQNGIVNIVVAFAPLKPAEFVIIKIAQLAGQTAAS
ncbi:MAG: phage tail sheath subtilisin-like domain-containing protein [Acetobacteraceae bacterium]